MRGWVKVVVTSLIVILVAGCLGQGPSTPFGAVPKVIFDYTNGEAVITVMAMQEYRYDEIHINYTPTSTGQRVGHSVFMRYAADVNISHLDFTLNVTVLTKGDIYVLNCDVSVKPSGSSAVFSVQEETKSKASDHDAPYTILTDWSDSR